VQLSVTFALIATGAIRWFGGQRAFGEALTD